MKAEELKAILEDHSKWLRDEGGKRADLSLADLRGADLREADLRGADLVGANLYGANLRWANLRGANLEGANPSGANLEGADLKCADLRWANLRGADLIEADLYGANLSGANLRKADLRGANITGAKIDIAICRMDFGGWSICVCADRTSIGCEIHPNEKWLAWTPESKEIKRMHIDAPAWWATHGEAIKSVIRCVIAKAKGGEA